MNLLKYHNFYLVGIKGVAMTSIAQCLIDAHKKVRGSDIAEKFVTQNLLEKLNIQIDIGFDIPIDPETDCVIYTAAHNGVCNPQVITAKKNNIACFSQAQALADLFNHKKGIAVCGVGGKSTTSAMITWLLNQANLNPSYSIGVGNITGLNKTGHWDPLSEYFIAEADEYVINPECQNPQHYKPRFSFLKPHITICTNLIFDHPDVYRNLEHTKQVFTAFFNQIQPHGYLIYNQDNQDLVQIVKKLRSDIKMISFGQKSSADYQLKNISYHNNYMLCNYLNNQQQTKQFKLAVPGKFNAFNALAALAAVTQINPQIDWTQLLPSFKSTQRRFEFIKEYKHIKCFDDYAHHPQEITATLKAIKQLFPTKKIFAAFQPHTYSRTKILFNEFVDSLGKSNCNILLTDIFPSAREQKDPSISSKLLCQAINKKYPDSSCKYIGCLNSLIDYCQTQLPPENIFITLGAGDIYKIYQHIPN